jgi:uncharacterized glyoxalase superfamily protein PhnB
MHTLTPNLVLRECSKAIEFYKSAFGAEERARFPAPDGRSIWHAELRIGDSIFFLNDEMPGMGKTAPSAEKPSPVTLWLYVPDCDAAFQRAVGAGGRVMMKPADMFWGDRCAGVADPFGYVWSFATHVRDMTMDDMKRGAEEFARSMQAAHAQR